MMIKDIFAGTCVATLVVLSGCAEMSTAPVGIKDSDWRAMTAEQQYYASRLEEALYAKAGRGLIGAADAWAETHELMPIGPLHGDRVMCEISGERIVAGERERITPATVDAWTGAEVEVKAALVDGGAWSEPEKIGYARWNRGTMTFCRDRAGSGGQPACATAVMPVAMLESPMRARINTADFCGAMTCSLVPSRAVSD